MQSSFSAGGFSFNFKPPKKHPTWNIFKDPTAYLLVASNLAVISSAVYYGIGIGAVLWGYWCQSIIIGFFSYFRIASLKQFTTEGVRVNGKQAEPTEATKKSISKMFAFIYGFFHIVYAFFLVVFSLFPESAALSLKTGEIWFVLATAATFFVNHSISFFYYSNKQQKQNIGPAVFQPFMRILPMHITIIFGAMLVMSGILQYLVVILFFSIKIAADVAMHALEHAEQSGQSG